MLILASVVTAAVNADAASVTLQWAAPTTNVDGSPLTDLSGYRIYFATSAPACPSGSFFTVASSTTTPAADQTVSTGIAGLNAGTTYFARVTAVDNSGNESTCSAAANGVAQADFSVTPSTATGFGSIATGSTADRTFTVQNTSGSSISGTVSIGAPFNILSGGSFSLAPGGSQTVTVRFAPTTAGTFAGNVNFTAGGDTVSRAVNGSATGGTTLTLSVTKSGTGSGTVTSTPAGINCGATCSQSVTPGTTVTLTATPAAGSAFAGWSGACSGTGACPVTVNAAATVTATFNVALPSLPGDPGTPSATQVAADANGVTFAVTWTAGSGATSYSYSAGFTDGTGGQQGSVPTTSMQLRMPYHSSGSASGGFACTQSVNAAGPGTGQSCATLQVPARPVTAVPLSLTKSGPGSGTVTSSPAGISCGATCSQSVTPGTTVTLTATPAAGSAFAGWSGACSGTGACAVTVNAATSVTATFNLLPVTLSVGKAGSGSGTVTSSPAGINCGATCLQSVTPGTTVTLTATPATGSAFAGWSGACSGTGSCAVTVNAAATVTATFNVALPSLPGDPGTPSAIQVAADANGVTFAVIWTAGSGATSYRYSAGFTDGTGGQQGSVPTTSMQLRMPYHSSGSASGGFACAQSVNTAGPGTGQSCATLQVPARPVTAVPLSVTKSGPGSGTVTSSPAGINCGATCSQSVTPGTTVTLTATPAAGSAFAGWSGACSGTGACAVTVNAATSVTATFNLLPVTLSVGKAGSGSGTVTSSPAGINCGATCSQSVTPGTAITLTATPAAGSAFAGWSGACSGVGICAVTVNSATGVGATFDTNPVDRPFAPNPTPLASSLSPATAPAGSAATMLTVNGSGFVPTSMVRWNGVARTTTFVSKTQLQATITKTDLANARSVPVTVFSPTPGGGTSGAVSFGITSSSTPPAAPGWPSVMKLSADMSGVTFAVAWTPVTGGASYRYSAGFSDGTAAQQGMVTVPSLQLRMPYYVTGAAASGFVCVASVNEAGQQSTSLACNAVAVPARPSTPTSTPPAGAPRPSGLVAAYAFDETSGSTVTDISGNNNTGTLGSGVLRTNQGRFGGALLFNGNDLVTVPNSPSLNLTTGMTLEAWVFPTASTNWAATLMKEQPGGLAYSLYASSSSSRPIVYFNTGKPTTRHRYLSGPAALPLNTWSHLAATYDGATLRLYLNGAQVSSQPHTGSIITSTGALRIGGDSAGEFFQGLIDEIRIYNRALSPSEILTDMSTGVGPRP